MGRLRPEQLHVTLGPHIEPDGPVTPRTYTLTHSDLTGDLFVTIAAEYDREQISGLYARLMRDEVQGEWQVPERAPQLHVHCHVSGGITLGTAAMRLAIFNRELPLVLEALRYGDGPLYAAHPSLEKASILAHLHARQTRYDQVEHWGTPADYASEA